MNRFKVLKNNVLKINVLKSSVRRGQPRPFPGSSWQKLRRGGHTLLELMIASSMGTLILGGLSGSLYVASRTFDQDGNAGNQLTAQQILGDLMADMNQAILFTERTANAVTFTVPDRTGDHLPETIRYSWGGTTGDSLTYEYNGSVATLANGVHHFDLSYLTRIMAADGAP